MAETQRTELLKIDGEGDGSNNHYTKNSITDNRDNLGNHSEEKENGELQAGFPEKDSGLKISLDESDESFKNGLTLSTLKKDDSGVDFEKSPASTGGQEGPLLSDCSESVSESLTDSAACSCTNSASDAKYEDKSKAIVSDDDQEELPGLDAADSCLESMISKDKCFLKRHSVVRHESMEADSEYIDEDNQEESSTDSAEKRKRRRGNAESSDDDTESDEDVEDEDEDTESKKCSSDSDGEIDVEYNNSKMPKHKWKALLDLRNREFGLSNKTPPNIFREAVTASLQMVQRFELQYKMEYHDGCVNALNFNRIGTLLASGSDDLNIVLWNWVRSRPALVFDSGHRSNVFQAKFMPFSGDCHVVSCARDGQVRLADLSLTGVCKGTKKIAQHKGAAHKLALELDSPHVFLSCGEDALTYEMDLRQEKPNKLVITKENEKKVPLYSIHSNPVNSLEFCVGGRDHYLRIYDKRKIAENVNGGVLKKFCPHHLIDSSIKANVTCACYNYNGTEVLGTYNDEDIYLFNNLDSDGADYIHRYQGHRNNATVKGVNFYGPKSEFIVSGSDCGHVFLWEKETESIVQFMEADDGGVINVLEPHPFAPVLATSGLDSDVKVWAPTAKEPTKLAGLKKVMKKNGHQRQVEQVQETDTIDGQMLWFLMNLHRRRARQEDGSDSSEDSDSDSDGSEEMPDRIQCAQS